MPMATPTNAATVPASTDPRAAVFRARFGIEPSHPVHWAWINYFNSPASAGGPGVRGRILEQEMEMWFIYGDDLV